MYNIAVIGCGYWGPNLIRNFSSLSECRVKTVCDKDDARLKHMKSLYPDVNLTNDYKTIVKDDEITAVAIATPVKFHYNIAYECLTSGKHVFIEKPMAMSAAECKELIDIATINNLVILVGHTFIYSPPVIKIKEIIQRKALGDIHYISARRLNLGLFQTDINVTWDLAPHDISIILYIMETLPDSVNCQGKAHVNPDIEDVTNMTLNFDNGTFATIQSSWLDPNKVREMTFVGSQRMLVYNDLEPTEKIKIYDKRVETPPYYDTFADFHYSYHYGDMYSPYLLQYEPLKKECQDFVNCISNGKTPESSAIDGMKVVQILESASLSLKEEGAKVPITDLYADNLLMQCQQLDYAQARSA